MDHAMKQEKIKKTIDVTLSLLENDDVIDRLASKFIKTHTSGQITQGDVKENMKKFSQLLKRNQDLKISTPKERFEYLVQDLKNLSNLTSTHSEFHFCNAIIDKMPEFLNTTFETIDDDAMETMMINFGKECEIANLENPLDLNPIFIDSFDLCSHLPDILKLHLSFGLPEYVEKNSEHFCTYLVDMIFPSAIEHPGMLIMEQMQYQYAKDESLKKLIPYPQVILANDFNKTFMKVCTSSIMGDKSEEFCENGFKKITEISNETFKNASTMTIPEYTHQFCFAIGFTLGEHANNLLEINKSTKYSTRNTISHVFSLAQGYRDGIMDSTGKLIQSTSEDLHDTILENVPVNRSLLELKTNDETCCPLETTVGVEPVDCYYDGTMKKKYYKAKYSMKKKEADCCEDKCFQKQLPNNGKIDDDETKKYAACRGRARTTGTSFGQGAGPFMVGGGFVHGYGNFLDANEQYKLPESRNGANIVKWAEQDFFEHCVGLSAGNSVPSDFDDLINIGMNFEIGWFNSFDNIPGFTVVTTASASVLIFATSASAIECCDTDDYYAADCVRCGTAIGLGIFLPPTWGDVDYSFESCYAYPVSERSNGNFDMSNCQKQDWRMWMECKGGPYHMITIHVISLNKEIPRIRGDICEKYPDEGPYIWRYDFTDPNVQGMVIRNNLPGQTVKIGRFGLRPLEKEWQRRRGVIFQGVTFGSKSGTNFFAGQIYTAPYGHSTTGELTYSQAKIVSQTWKCEKWNFTKEQCCNSKLQENGEGCYWHTAGKKGQCRGLPAPAQTTCEPEQNATQLKLYETGVLDDEALFNDHWSVGAIICRHCPGCASSHQHICYKRLTEPAGAASNGYILFTTNWYNNGNVLNTDFELYSSLEDAKIGSNKWNYCNYNDPGIGFPRDCGPTGPVGGQWNSRNRGGKTVTYWSPETVSTGEVLYNDLLGRGPHYLEEEEDSSIGLTGGNFCGLPEDVIDNYLTPPPIVQDFISFAFGASFGIGKLKDHDSESCGEIAALIGDDLDVAWINIDTPDMDALTEAADINVEKCKKRQGKKRQGSVNNCKKNAKKDRAKKD